MKKRHHFYFDVAFWVVYKELLGCNLRKNISSGTVEVIPVLFG